MAGALDKKASRARIMGTISFCLTMMIGLGIVSLFLFSHGLEPPSESKIKETAAASLGILSKLGSDTKAEKITETYVNRDLTFQILNTAIVRVGSVIISVFLIQILVGFSRYYYRVAEHLSACADVVRLGKGDVQIIKDLAPIFVPSVEFSKLPKSPIQGVLDKAMDTMKEMATKIPAK